MPLIDEHNDIKEFGAIACITCHNPHRWKPGENKQAAKKVISQGKPENQDGDVLSSFLRRKGAKGTFCIDCHGLEARVKYKYYHDEFTRDTAVDYIE
jgi:nitrate/TMAO reductase-like tetraheme cytochrome c subunit